MAALQQARARLGLSPEGNDERIDPEHTALVRQARAVLDEARLTRDRSVKLLEQQLIARAQLDTAEALEVADGRYQDALEEVRNRQAVLAQRRSELELARQQLTDTVVLAPFDGAVSERRASRGEYLAAGAPVVTLVAHPPAAPAARRARARGHRRGRGPDRPAVDRGRPDRLQRAGGPPGPHRPEHNRTLIVEAEVPNEDGRCAPAPSPGPRS